MSAIDPPLPNPKISLEDLAGNARRHRRENAFRGYFFLAALFSVLVSVAIVGSLVVQAWEFIVDVDWSLLWSEAWNPRNDAFDLRTLLVASFMVTGIAMAVAGPVGLASAVFLSEYAGARTRNVLKPILEILAGIPSVVIGYFAITWIAPNVVAPICPGGGVGGNMLAAGLGVGLLTIPLVASVSEDAMKAVPVSLREASQGLGARRMTTSIRVVIPAAVSGLVAAFILAFSRALGETMVVFIAGGAADTASFTADACRGSLTMTAAMASLASGTDQVRGSGLAYPSLFFVGLVLFAVTLGLNVVAGRFVRRVRQQY